MWDDLSVRSRPTISAKCFAVGDDITFPLSRIVFDLYFVQSGFVFARVDRHLEDKVSENDFIDIRISALILRCQAINVCSDLIASSALCVLNAVAVEIIRKIDSLAIDGASREHLVRKIFSALR